MRPPQYSEQRQRSSRLDEHRSHLAHLLDPYRSRATYHSEHTREERMSELPRSPGGLPTSPFEMEVTKAIVARRIEAGKSTLFSPFSLCAMLMDDR